jgi:hypothetical protein
LAELNCLRDLKDNQASKCEAMLYQIRSLPAEVLSEIFLHCLPETPDFNPKTAPVLLCQVTSSCRQIALSVPQLWCRLWFPFGCQTTKIIRKLSPVSIDEAAVAWIKRSGGLPISLSLNAYTEESVGQFIGLLRKHSSRVGHLGIVATKASVVPVLHALDVDFANLNSLHISSSAGFRSQPSFFVAMPNLRKLCLDTTSDTSLSLPIPWSQITHLSVPGDIHAIVLSQWRQLLSQ